MCDFPPGKQADCIASVNVISRVFAATQTRQAVAKKIVAKLLSRRRGSLLGTSYNLVNEKATIV